MYICTVFSSSSPILTNTFSNQDFIFTIPAKLFLSRSITSSHWQTSPVETEISKAHNINFVFGSRFLTPCYVCSVRIHHVSDKSREADEHILYLILPCCHFQLWNHPEPFLQKPELEQSHAEFNVCHSAGWRQICDRACPLWSCEELVLEKLWKRSSLTRVYSVTLDLHWSQDSSSDWEAMDK